MCKILSGKPPADKTGFHVLHPFFLASCLKHLLPRQAARAFRLARLVVGDTDQAQALAA